MKTYTLNFNKFTESFKKEVLDVLKDNGYITDAKINKDDNTIVISFVSKIKEE